MPSLQALSRVALSGHTAKAAITVSQALGADDPSQAEPPHGMEGGQSPAGLGGLAEATSRLLTRAGVVQDDLDSAFLTHLLSKLGLDPSLAPQVGDAFGEFTRARSPEEVRAQLERIAPFLASGHFSTLGKLW